MSPSAAGGPSAAAAAAGSPMAAGGGGAIDEESPAASESPSRSRVNPDLLKLTEATGTARPEPLVPRVDVPRVELAPVPCDQRDDEKVINVLIKTLKPSLARHTPAPAVLLFQCVLYQTDDSHPVKFFSLIDAATKSLRSMAQKMQNAERGALAYWLGSTGMLTHLVRRYKPRVDPESQYEARLTETMVLLFNHLVRGAKQQLLPMIVPALLQSQSNLGIGTSAAAPAQAKKTGMSAMVAGLLHRQATVVDVTRVLQDLLLELQRNCVAPSITDQVFAELFHFSATHSFNKLLLRRELCQWERAMGIKYNIAQLAQGAHNLGLGEAMGRLFEPVRQVLALLLLNKGVVNEDPSIIVDVCPGLNSLQVRQALSLFTAGEYETPVDPAVIANVRMPRDGEPGAPATLLLDATVTRGLRPFDSEVEDREYECLITTPLADEVARKITPVLGDVAKFTPTLDSSK
jgi:myosin-5